MKDQFGNDIYVNTTGNNHERNNTIYNDSDKSMTELDRDNREKSINIQGDTTFGNNDMNTSQMNGNDAEKVLVGIFETEREASSVITRLKEIGYEENDITVIAKDKGTMQRLEGDVSNMGKGAAIGGTIGGLAAVLPALGVLAIPGIGPILAAGPIAVILGGIVAGGVTGGFIGAMTELGVNEVNAKQYEYQLEQGKIIVLVENKNNMRDEVYSTYRQNNTLIDMNSTKK